MELLHFPNHMLEEGITKFEIDNSNIPKLTQKAIFSNNRLTLILEKLCILKIMNEGKCSIYNKKGK